MPKNKHNFTEKERQELAKKGQALPDGSFPIRNTQDLKDAIKSIGLAKDKEVAKKWIIKRAKELNATDLLPEDWGVVTKSLVYVGYDSLNKSYVFRDTRNQFIRKTPQQVVEQHPDVAIEVLKKVRKSLESANEFIEKGKKAQIGEIREWNGQKMQKQADGSWTPVKGETSKEKKKDESKKKEESNTVSPSKLREVLKKIPDYKTRNSLRYYIDSGEYEFTKEDGRLVIKDKKTGKTAYHGDGSVIKLLGESDTSAKNPENTQKKEELNKTVELIAKLLNRTPYTSATSDSVFTFRMKAKKLGRELGMTNEQVDKMITEANNRVKSSRDNNDKKGAGKLKEHHKQYIKEALQEGKSKQYIVNRLKEKGVDEDSVMKELSQLSKK